MEVIKELLQKQLEIEESSIKLYNSFILKIEEGKIKDKIFAIKRDEEKHVEQVKNMISLMDGLKIEEINEVSDEKFIDLDEFLNDYQSLLLITNIEKIALVLLSILNQVKKQCIFLSYNKMSKFTKKFFEENSINTDRIKFVDIINTESAETTISPAGLTDISIGIEKTLREFPDSFVLVDNLSSFKTYHDSNTIANFLSSINTKITNKNSGIIWLIFENEKELIEKTSGLCNKTIKTI